MVKKERKSNQKKEDDNDQEEPEELVGLAWIVSWCPTWLRLWFQERVYSPLTSGFSWTGAVFALIVVALIAHSFFDTSEPLAFKSKEVCLFVFKNQVTDPARISAPEELNLMRFYCDAKVTRDYLKVDDQSTADLILKDETLRYKLYIAVFRACYDKEFIQLSERTRLMHICDSLRSEPTLQDLVGPVDYFMRTRERYLCPKIDGKEPPKSCIDDSRNGPTIYHVAALRPHIEDAFLAKKKINGRFF